ncbi:hypothetical protein JCM3774_006749 [Rhodotorula dairenensis]
MAYARSSSIALHHPFAVVDLDQLDLGHLAAVDRRRQEWEYAQHVMHLRRRQQEQERARARKMRAAAAHEAEQQERHRRRLRLVEAYAMAAAAAAENDRRQYEIQLQLQRQEQQQQRAQQARHHHQRRRRLHAHARDSRRSATGAEFGRQLSHVIGSLDPSAVQHLYYDVLNHDDLSEEEEEVDDDDDEAAGSSSSSPSPVGMFFRLFGEQGHDDRDEKVEPALPHTAVADPEELDLAAAAAFAAATVPEEEDEIEQDTVEDSASESSVDDRDSASGSGRDDDSADAKAEEFPAPSPAASVEVDCAAAAAALDSLAALAQDFAARRRSFVSPTTLSFQPATSSALTASRSPTPPLAFESNNTPFLGYEDFLVSLLSQIDAVDSHGVREVRLARKNLVKEVEHELARLDDLKDQAWERLSATSSLSTTSSVSESEAISGSEAGSEEDDTEMTPEPVEFLATEEASVFSRSVDDDLDFASASEDGEEASDVHVRVPFAIRRHSTAATSSPRSARRFKVRSSRNLSPDVREASPAVSDASSSFPTSSSDIADQEQVADILLQAQRLGEEVARLEEAERDQQQKRRRLIDAESESDSDEEMVLMYF